MKHRALFAIAWLLGSALILVAGFLVSVYMASRFGGDGDAESVRQLRLALSIYAQVVLFKGLLPQLVLAWACWPLLDRAFALRARGRAAIALGLVVGSALASLVVAARLLPAPLFGLGSVHYTGAANFLRTCAEMTLATALALAMPRLLAPRRVLGPIEPVAWRWTGWVPLAGLAGVALAGAVSVAVEAEHLRTAVASGGPTPASVGPPLPLPAPVPQAGPAVVSDGPGEPLPLHLLKTQVEALASQSLALVFDREARSVESLHEGDRFARHPDALLARIEADHVVIDRDGRLETLWIENPADLFAALGIPREQSPEARERMRRLTESLEERIAAEREGRPVESSETLRGGLLAEGDVRPHFTDGALQGLELENLQPGGTFDRVGLRDGDFVTAVNGIPFQSFDGAVVRQISRSAELELSVQRRDGTQQSIALPTAVLLQELSAALTSR